MNWPAHGANPRQLYQQLGLPLPATYVDFSVNTNPYVLPLSLWPTQADFCRWAMEYPDPDAMPLVDFLARAEGISPGCILMTNGASECIYLLGQLFSQKRIGIAEPAFSEYRRACEAHGCKIVSLVTNEEKSWKYELSELTMLLKDVDVFFLCHPNNPTGTVMAEEELYELLMAAEKAKTFVIIDEAFYHFWADGFTALQWIGRFSHLIVLRSLTKIHHLAGARIGYMVANEEIIAQAKALQPPWSVSKVAQQLALHFLPMDEFVAQTKRMIAAERERIAEILRGYGYYVSPSVVNFYLLRLPSRSTEALFYHLLREGMVPRHTMNFRGLDGKYLRLAVKTKEENDQLLQALRRWAQ
ncbi:threonine-phosphate decarboxylase CobD [Parageobacillus thermoglucosidasius]|uniref:threonine-phosphate decarboxylase n=1 Tax=Parageobacillus thermoglucosidasius TaxID=1426 RepID=A0AB38QYL1_PARTM|nr:threonine-phosphate decarboxylase CobD [Parageobacillus thermoglucosidasius]EID44990.1 L-threonine-O-3-phosphate decarboxylase [Parageobacillus thermoglucosidasius TNO-09.020]UOE75230.1 threonine-phosphate decarboxylase [Parageobacillus thermoglucosidasius]